MRRRQRVGDAEQQLDRLAPCVMSGAHPIGQRAAVGQLRDEVLPAVELADVMNRDDVRMIQRGRRLRFPLEAAPFGGRRELGGQKLDRDRAIQPGVVSQVDDAHAAFAEHRLNPVCSQRDAGVEPAHGTRMLSHSPPTSLRRRTWRECLTHTVIERKYCPQLTDLAAQTNQGYPLRFPAHAHGVLRPVRHDRAHAESSHSS